MVSLTPIIFFSFLGQILCHMHDPGTKGPIT